jgi:VanZ family protein
MKHDSNIIKNEWNSSSRLTKYWAVTLLLLVAGSILPSPPLIHRMMAIDTIAHLFLYAFLALVPMVLLSSRKNAFLASIAVTPLGYILETIYTLITGNSFNVMNSLANNIGSLIGIGTGFIVRLNNHYEQQKACTTAADKKS